MSVKFAYIDSVEIPTAERSPGERHNVWPTAVIVFGLGLSAAWTCLLGYGLVKLVELVL